ncbi:hypothetical protein EDD11_005065 [Mortierella claussenii]|nr:hypothetical protein EDD11_005065 [Mortierella claussenii]
MSSDKGYYTSPAPQYPQQAAYGQPAYGQPAYGQAASYQPGYPPQQYGAPQPAYGQQPYPASPGYYGQPSPQPQIIIHQQAPQQQSNKNDDLCFGW